MIDFWGNAQEEPDEYTAYMASAKWAKKRTQKLEQAGYKCEACGQSKYSGPLDVHHLTYERLGHERMEDLQVLCKNCHDGADEQRIEDVRAAKAKSALYVGFLKWAEKGQWEWGQVTSEHANRLRWEYLRYMKRITGKSYSLDLTILGKHDTNPGWKP